MDRGAWGAVGALLPKLETLNPKHKSAPEGGDVRVGDHDGLQVEAAISHKHDRVRFADHRGCCAPQNLTCRSATGINLL